MGTIVNLVLLSNPTPAEMRSATGPQILLNAPSRQALVKATQQAALRRIPAGPHHVALARQAALQVPSLLDQIFTAVKQALASSLHQGFVAILILSSFALLASFFLKDVPFSEERTPQQEEEKVE